MTKNISTLKAAMEARLAELQDENKIAETIEICSDGMTFEAMEHEIKVKAKIEVLESLLNEYCRP